MHLSVYLPPSLTCISGQSRNGPPFGSLPFSPFTRDREELHIRRNRDPNFKRFLWMFFFCQLLNKIEMETQQIKWTLDQDKAGRDTYCKTNHVDYLESWEYWKSLNFIRDSEYWKYWKLPILRTRQGVGWVGLMLWRYILIEANQNGSTNLEHGFIPNTYWST